MTRSFIPYRIIFDFNGIMEIKEKLNGTTFANFVYKLMYINTNTLQNKRKQIITSKKSFDRFATELTNEIDDSTINILEPAIRPQNEPLDIEAIEDEVKRIWEHTLYVSSKDPPFQSIIFTANRNLSDYEALKKQDKKDNIIINDGDKAINNIETLYKICKEGHEN